MTSAQAIIKYKLGFDPVRVVAEAKHKGMASLKPSGAVDIYKKDPIETTKAWRANNLAQGLTANGTVRKYKLWPELKPFRGNKNLYHLNYVRLMRGKPLTTTVKNLWRKA